MKTQARVMRCSDITSVSQTDVYEGDAEARHLDMKLLPLSTDELDMSILYTFCSLTLARSLVLGMFSGSASISSRVDWRENSVVASV